MAKYFNYMKKIILDTNFLMVPYKLRVDIFSEFDRICSFNYKLFIFEQSIEELKNIIHKQAGKDKKGAEFALELIKLKNIGIIKSERKEVDTLMLRHLNEDNIVATLDMQLKKELLKKSVSVIILRQKKYLQLIEGKLYK